MCEQYHSTRGAMKSAIQSILILSLSWLPAIAVGSVVQIAGAQTQPPQSADLQQLIKQAQQGKPQQAIETLQKALVIAQQFQNRDAEATALLRTGFNFESVGQPEKALEYYIQALPIFQAIGDQKGEAK